MGNPSPHGDDDHSLSFNKVLKVQLDLKQKITLGNNHSSRIGKFSMHTVPKARIENIQCVS